MDSRTKRVITILGAATLLLVGMAGVAGAVVLSAGTVRVRVEEKKPGGDRLNLLLPAAVVPLGIRFMPERDRERVAEQMRPWAPAMRAAVEELRRTSDTTLVEVENSREHVRITKEGDSLQVHVDSEEETLYVSVPLKLVARLATDFEGTY